MGEGKPEATIKQRLRYPKSIRSILICNSKFIIPLVMNLLLIIKC